MTAEVGNGWTLETLYIHLTKIMDERDRHYQQRIEAQEKAVFMALTQVIDDFRLTLNEQLSSFLPRSDYDRSLGGLSKRVDDIHKTMLDKLDSVVKSVNSQIESVEIKISAVESVVR